MEPFERSTVQLMSIIRRDEEKDKTDSFPYTSTTHSTLREKKFVPLYVEDLHFLITRTGWLVTCTYEHYTFEQEKFKKDFVVMNKKARQHATSSVERDFYKLLNNSNFGIDCRDNIDNCIIEPLYDDTDEVSYIQKFVDISDDRYSDFHNSNLLKEVIIQKFNSKTLGLDKKK